MMYVIFNMVPGPKLRLRYIGRVSVYLKLLGSTVRKWIIR